MRRRVQVLEGLRGLRGDPQPGWQRHHPAPTPAVEQIAQGPVGHELVHEHGRLEMEAAAEEPDDVWVVDAAEHDQLLDELIRPALLDLLASLHRDSVSAEGGLVDGAMCSFPDDVGLVKATCGLITRSPLSYKVKAMLLSSVSRIRNNIRPPCCSK